MKSQRDTLDLVHDLAKRREMNAATRLRQGHNRYRELADKRDELKTYRGEYTRGVSTVVNVGQLSEFRRFVVQLDEAITGADSRLRTMKDEIEGLRRDWEILHARSVAFEKIMIERHKEQRRSREKRSNRDLDEIALRHANGS